MVCGGDEGARTPDLGIANAALSQLSYIPTQKLFIYQIITDWSIDKIDGALKSFT